VLGRKSKDADASAGPVGDQEDASGPYQVVLHVVGPKKISVIKEVRSLTRPQMDLAHAKALVDAAGSSPQVVLRFEDRSRAEVAAARFGATGAAAVVAGGDATSALLAPAVALVANGAVATFTCPFCNTVSSGAHCDNCGAPRHAT